MTTIVVKDGGGVNRTIPTIAELLAVLGRSTATATIASGASLSGAVDLGANFSMARITMPAAWTAAGLSFQTSADGVTYNEMLDDALSPVSAAVAANSDFALNRDVWRGVRYLKIRSGTSGTPVNQGADRAIVITAATIN